MVSYAELKSMTFENLTNAAGASESMSSDLSDRAGEVLEAADINPEEWFGSDSEAASSAVNSNAPPLEDASDVFHRAQAALEDLAEEMSAAQEHLSGADDAVAGTKARIEADGTVVVPDGLEEDEAETAHEAARQARDIIDEALEMAEDADSSAVAALNALGMSTDANDIPDGSDDSPEDVNDWWEGLSEAEQQAYINDHPEIIGNLDGVPAEARDQANRLHLDAERERLETELDKPGDRPYEEQQLENLQEIESQLEDGDDLMLLGFDAGDSGQVIIANGNPDTADNVYTHVPGTDASVENGLDGHMDRIERLTNEANELGGETAGIMWLDYNAPTFNPSEGPTPASEHVAMGAASDLQEFHEGLRSVNGDAHMTAAGHSYGSTVVGHAGHQGDGLDVDAMLLVGSPGTGVDTAAELGIGDDNVYHATSGGDWAWQGDPIRHTPGAGHGTTPYNEDFGGVDLDVDDGIGHSGYWNDPFALDQMAWVVSGNGEHISR